MSFPVDEITLCLLKEAISIGDDGRSHLLDFLAMADVWNEQDNMYHGYSPSDVILALIAEIERLRSN